MIHLRSENESERLLAERYRRHWERNRAAHLRHSPSEAAHRRRARRRRRRLLRYLLFTLCALAAAVSLAVAAFVLFST